MNKIVSKEHFSANVVKLEVEAPLIARSRKAGHFVIVKVGDKVLTSKYSGTEVKVDGEECTIVRQSDILAIVE